MCLLSLDCKKNLMDWNKRFFFDVAVLITCKYLLSKRSQDLIQENKYLKTKKFSKKTFTCYHDNNVFSFIHIT